LKNFFDCKDEKITEKAFSQSLIISVVSILLCLVALCSMTYAWFTSETSSSSNTLMSGSFDVDITISKVEDDVATASENRIEVSADGSYLLADPGTYTVTLQPTGEATVKGYCIVTIDGKDYKTGVIYNAEMVDDTYKNPTAPLKFQIDTDEADTTVKFEAHWGVLVNPDITEGGTITIETKQEKTETTEQG